MRTEFWIPIIIKQVKKFDVDDENNYKFTIQYFGIKVFEKINQQPSVFKNVAVNLGKVSQGVTIDKSEITTGFASFKSLKKFIFNFLNDGFRIR